MDRHEASLRWALALVVAEHDQPTRQRPLDELTRDGACDALTAWGDVRTLPEEAAETQIRHLADAVDRLLTNARRGISGMGRDIGRALALLCLYHPQQARWEPLVQLLSQEGLMAEQRAGALRLCNDLADNIPADQREAFLEAARALSEEQVEEADALFDRPGSSRRGGQLLLHALGGLAPEQEAEQLLVLLDGEGADRQAAAAMVARLSSQDGSAALVTLSADADPMVRAIAAGALAERAADSHPATTAALQRAIEDPGTLVPLAVASNLPENGGDQAARFRASLQGHLSAQVRRAAQPSPAPAPAPAGEAGDG